MVVDNIRMWHKATGKMEVFGHPLQFRRILRAPRILRSTSGSGYEQPQEEGEGGGAPKTAQA